jgi:hypothetical protein
MKKLLAIALLVGSLGTAFAGARYGYPVYVDTVNRRAWGSVGDARSSSDYNAMIECDVTATSSGQSVGCSVINGAGVRAYCYSFDPNFVQAAASLKDGGALYITWDTSSRCTYLGSFTSSAWSPKQP